MLPSLRGRRTAPAQSASSTPLQTLTPRELDACLVSFRIPARKLAPDLQRNGQIELVEQAIQSLKHPHRRDLRTLMECRLEDANSYVQHLKQLEAAFTR